MPEESSVKIRLLTARDIPAAMRLKELAHWNQTESDWRRLIELEPRGCFVGCVNGQVIATTTTTIYESELAWIGMVLVNPEQRRRGIATRLMLSALDHIRDAGVLTVKLDATAAGRAVYEILGFESETRIERWEGIAPSVTTMSCLNFDAQVTPEILALDRRAFGANRTRLLELIFSDPSTTPLIIRDADGELRGYVLIRPGTSAFYIGPLVAADHGAAVALLDGALHQVAGHKIYIDLNTRFKSGSQLLAERRLVKQRDLIRMRSGQNSHAGTSDLIFAIAGPEIG